MSYQQPIRDLLKGHVDDAFYWGVTPDTGPENAYYIVASQQGGQAAWYLENAMPDHKHARILIHCFGPRTVEVDALSSTIQAALCQTPPAGFAIRPEGAPIDTYDQITKDFGKMQYFLVWYPDP